MSLVDHVNAMQLAIQAAISDAFKTPEVLRLFVKQQPGQLRQRVDQVGTPSLVVSIGRDIAISLVLSLSFYLSRSLTHYLVSAYSLSPA